MNKFSHKLEKPCFWQILGPFSQFLGQKNFSWKIRLYHAQLHMGFQRHAKIQKKLTTQFKENARTDRRTEGRTDPILQDLSGYRRGSNKLFIIIIHLYQVSLLENVNTKKTNVLFWLNLRFGNHSVHGLSFYLEAPLKLELPPCLNVPQSKKSTFTDIYGLFTITRIYF